MAEKKTISITLSALAHAAQYLGVLGSVKKEGKVALDISMYRIANVDTQVKAFSEAEAGVFKDLGIEPNEQGSMAVEKGDENYEAVVTQLEEIRSRRVSIDAFPVSLETLVKSIEKFENNPINENLLVGLNVLVTGEPEETVH